MVVDIRADHFTSDAMLGVWCLWFHFPATCLPETEVLSVQVRGHTTLYDNSCI